MKDNIIEKLEDTSINTDEITYREISDPAVMAKQPVVSVKMLTYNHEPYITQAIEGVLMQECDFPIELIIGEDCSTDRTREIVMEYQQKRPDLIRVVAWDKNTGGRRNSRIVNGLMRGKYIAWCEGDDYWIHPKKLQMQVDVFESNAKAVLVAHNADVVDVDGMFVREYNAEMAEILSDLPPILWTGRKGNNFDPRRSTKCLHREGNSTASSNVKQSNWQLAGINP